MQSSDPIILLETEASKTLPADEVRTFDQEDVILVITATGVRPIKIFARDQKISWVFKRAETVEVLDTFLSGGEVNVDVHKFLKALTLWKSALVMMKTRRAELS